MSGEDQVRSIGQMLQRALTEATGGREVDDEAAAEAATAASAAVAEVGRAIRALTASAGSRAWRAGVLSGAPQPAAAGTPAAEGERGEIHAPAEHSDGADAVAPPTRSGSRSRDGTSDTDSTVE